MENILSPFSALGEDSWDGLMTLEGSLLPRLITGPVSRTQTNSVMVYESVFPARMCTP